MTAAIKEEFHQRIGISGGAGRIGKLTAYELIQQGVVIGQINDLATTDQIVTSLSKKDSVHGKLEWGVKKISESAINIETDKGAHMVKVSHEKQPGEIEWKNYRGGPIEIVAECSGAFTERSAAEWHFSKNRELEAVIISAPGKDMKTLVMGVNHQDYKKSDRVISNASCTTKALALPLRVLFDNGYKMQAMFFNTVHAATNTERLLDFGGVYGSLDNINSHKTGASKALAEVIPELKGVSVKDVSGKSEIINNSDGFAWRVPTRDGSFAGMYMVLEAERGMLTKDRINACFVEAFNYEKYIGRIDTFCEKEVSSSDIIGNKASSVVAIAKTGVIMLPLSEMDELHKIAGVEYKRKALVQIISGYDNELGSAKDLADLAVYILGRK